MEDIQAYASCNSESYSESDKTIIDNTMESAEPNFETQQKKCELSGDAVNSGNQHDSDNYDSSDFLKRKRDAKEDSAHQRPLLRKSPSEIPELSSNNNEPDNFDSKNEEIVTSSVHADNYGHEEPKLFGRVAIENVEGIVDDEVPKVSTFVGKEVEQVSPKEVSSPMETERMSNIHVSSPVGENASGPGSLPLAASSSVTISTSGHSDSEEDKERESSGETSPPRKRAKLNPKIKVASLVGRRDQASTSKKQPKRKMFSTKKMLSSRQQKANLPAPKSSSTSSLNQDIEETIEEMEDEPALDCDEVVPISSFVPDQTDSEDDEKVDSLDKLRKSNIEKLSSIISSLRNPELEKQFAENRKRFAGSSNSTKSKKSSRPRSNRDSSVRFNVRIPVETRKSTRLQNKVPEYREGALDYVQESVRNIYFKRPNYNLDDYSVEDLEEVVYRPRSRSSKSSRRSGVQREETRSIIPVEEVTQEMLDNIAVRVKTKQYSQNGTTCHQCRQKTLDQKTCCRNPSCIGIQGMFCGVCIKNRYGEDCATALLDPNWICPVCRGKCNCSICRNRQGKRPTGVLAPLALQSGFNSVDHFLTNLRGQGDKPEEDEMWALAREPEALLGFSDGGRRAHLQSGESVSAPCGPCAIKDCDNSENLLGFSKDGKVAVMGGNKHDQLFY